MKQIKYKLYIDNVLKNTLGQPVICSQSLENMTSQILHEKLSSEELESVIEAYKNPSVHDAVTELMNLYKKQGYGDAKVVSTLRRKNGQIYYCRVHMQNLHLVDITKWASKWKVEVNNLEGGTK